MYSIYNIYKNKYVRQMLDGEWAWGDYDHRSFWQTKESAIKFQRDNSLEYIARPISEFFRLTIVK